MTTVILKENGNETIKANLKFRVLTGGDRLDRCDYDSYTEAKARKEVLQRILKHKRHEIIVTEG